jgi:alpha-mannosidase
MLGIKLLRRRERLIRAEEAGSRDEVAMTDPLVVVIPNAHIDPVWIWDWREGMREVLATFTAAADRLDANDDLSFAASSAAYYQWVQQSDPVLFGRIKQHVASGRWTIVGGEWVEPDCNLPAGESVCRQLLYGQRYFHEAFGSIATVAYNVDSFGHAGSLPQLFRKAGLGAYVMMRPQEHEKSLPASLFAWEGVDGTRLTTYRIHGAYQTGLPAHAEPSVAAEENLIESRAAELLKAAGDAGAPGMFFVGVGDHGGGPTTVAIARVRALHEESAGAITFGSVDRFFRQVRQGRADGRVLPTVRGDLHMHAVGCYSVVAWIKRENAICEDALSTAEKMASLCEMATGVRLDAGPQLRAAWTRVLFNQFHDALGGTCTKEVCGDLRQFYGYARTVADDIMTRATQLVARETDTWIDGADASERPQSLNPFLAHFPVPVVVFNPLARPVRVPLEFPHPAASVTAADGPAVAVQQVFSREGTRYSGHSMVIADLPPLGTAVYWLHREPPRSAPAPVPASPGALAATDDRLENEGLVVRIDRQRGTVASIVSKPTGREWLLPEGLRPVVVADPSDTWSHGVVRYEGTEHECELREVRCAEDGPLRAVIRLSYAWADSLIYQDLILHAGLGELSVVLRVDWRERHQLLKLVVPVQVSGPALTAGVPYGAAGRPADGQEEVLLHWLHLVEPGSGGGVVCTSDFGYAYDAEGGRLRFTVLRSPSYADHGAPWTTEDPIDQPATDRGWHEVSYRLRFHDESLPADAGPRQAERHTTRFPHVSETWHRGPLGASASAIDVTPGHVSVPVVKRAEDGGGWVLRVCELAGRATAARIALPFLDRTWTGQLRAFDVVTLFVPDTPDAEVREVALTELDVNPAGAVPAGGATVAAS